MKIGTCCLPLCTAMFNPTMVGVMRDLLDQVFIGLLSFWAAALSTFFCRCKSTNGPFFNDLVTFMTSGPVMVQVLEGYNAVAKHREIMGATNPKEADAGTIRADFAESLDENAVHGSDSRENAEIEIAYFFGDDGFCPRTR